MLIDSRSTITWLPFASSYIKFHAIHVHFFDERLAGCKAKDLNSILEAYFEIYPNVPAKGDLYLFLDEIEVVEGWELFVERQLRLSNRKVFITGSSSRLLSKEIATAMRGRSLSFEVFPFSFNEIPQWEKLANTLIRTASQNPSPIPNLLNARRLSRNYSSIPIDSKENSSRIL